MRRLAAVFLVIFLVTAVTTVRAQSYFTATEVGIAVGGSQYFGDLNDNYGFRTLGFAGGIYARRRLGPYIAIKLVGNYTKVGYDDKFNSDLYDQQRNLNFKSQVMEVAVQAEFNFFKFITGDSYSRFTPYLTGGIGAFYYNPYTTLNGVKYDLRPLGTEGQNAGYADRKYGSVSPCFPIGIGVKFWITGGVNLTLEVADRLTTTDYLDDVSATYVGASKFSQLPGKNTAYLLQDRSGEVTPTDILGRAGKQRGNTSSYDQYLLAQISMSWNFTTYRCPAGLNDDLIRVR